MTATTSSKALALREIAALLDSRTARTRRAKTCDDLVSALAADGAIAFADWNEEEQETQLSLEDLPRCPDDIAAWREADTADLLTTWQWLERAAKHVAERVAMVNLRALTEEGYLVAFVELADLDALLSAAKRAGFDFEPMVFGRQLAAANREAKARARSYEARLAEGAAMISAGRRNARKKIPLPGTAAYRKARS